MTPEATATPAVNPDVQKAKAERDAIIKAETERKAKEEQARKAHLETLNDVPVVIVGAGLGGGPFNIRGEGFGDEKGSLTVGGVPAEITRWDDEHIRGVLPESARGTVILHTKNGIRTGVYLMPV